jgi:hypothetical protein
MTYSFREPNWIVLLVLLLLTELIAPHCIEVNSACRFEGLSPSTFVLLDLVPVD